MINKSKTVDVIWKMNPSTFEQINADIYAAPSLRLGSKRTSVDRMVNTYGNEMKVLLPSVIGVSLLDNNWYKALKYYWDSVSYVIPTGGKLLEVGFTYDMNDFDKKANIEALMSKVKEIVTESDLANYCESKIAEEEKYLYARPIKLEDYLMYRYCLVDSDVANNVTDAGNSTRIKFILSSESEKQEMKRKLHLVKTKADTKYIQLLADPTQVSNVLYAAGFDVTNLDQVDREIKLKEYSISNPSDFVTITEDKNLLLRAKIERYIIKGLLKRLPDSSIIVDSDDISYVIGSDINSAIVFFKSEDAAKVAKVTELASKAKK